MDKEALLQHLTTLTDGITDLENYTDSLDALKLAIEGITEESGDSVNYREKYENLRTEYLKRFSDVVNNVNNTPIIEEEYDEPDEEVYTDKEIDWDGEND